MNRISLRDTTTLIGYINRNNLKSTHQHLRLLTLVFWVFH